MVNDQPDCCAGSSVALISAILTSTHLCWGDAIHIAYYGIKHFYTCFVSWFTGQCDQCIRCLCYKVHMSPTCFAEWVHFLCCSTCDNITAGAIKLRSAGGSWGHFILDMRPFIYWQEDATKVAFNTDAGVLITSIYFGTLVWMWLTIVSGCPSNHMML